MSDLFHGYYGKSGYTFGYYPETMPLHLQWVCALQGHTAAAGKFRYLDAGCGQGLNLIIAAACYPEAEFVGIDFLPEHIAHAQSLAKNAGLKNVTFIEADFIELSENPEVLGNFDYVICHGIMSWISVEVRDCLYRLVGRVLRPGGVFYNSYNTYPGWLAMVPFQHLVRLEQRIKTGPEALLGARSILGQLNDIMPSMFVHLPGLKERLDSLVKQDPSYLLQEYNHLSWHPLFVSDVIDSIEAVKLSYLGTSTLTEIDETIYPEQFKKMLLSMNYTSAKEQLKDFATHKSFRRDIFVKGRLSPWKLGHEDLVRSFHIHLNPLLNLPEENQSFRFSAGALTFQGDPDYYRGLINAMKASKDRISIGSLIDSQTDPGKKKQAISAINLMLSAGYLQLINPQQGDYSSSERLNAVLTKEVCKGAPYRFIAAPQLGGAVNMTDTDWIILEYYNNKYTQERVCDFVYRQLDKLGRRMAKNGVVVDDKIQALKLIEDSDTFFKEQKYPYLKAIGAVPVNLNN